MKRFLLIAVALLISLSITAQERFVEHRVKWFETLASISEKYGVAPETILRYNNMEEGDVKARVLLRIPLTPLPEQAEEQQAAAEEVPEAQSQEEEEIPNTIFDADNPLKVSLILPFGAGSENPSVNYFDFYSGALMALRSATAAGLPVELSVYDLKSTSFETLILNPEFASSKLIIGPPHASELEPFAAFALEHQIALVSPMDPGAEHLVSGNPYLFQVPTSSSVRLSNLLGRLNPSEEEEVLVFYDSSMKEEALVGKITSSLDSMGIAYRPIGYGLLNGRDLSENLQKELDPEKEYKVIVASEDDAFAPDIVRNMRVLKLFAIPVELYCSNRVRNFESIDSDSFYELSTHVCASYFIDYSSENVGKFVYQYRALFNAEPTPYSFQGFDIISYFATTMCTAGSNFIFTADRYPMDMLQCSIRFARDDEKSGWRNIATRNISYNEDLTISVDR